jgi:hypothetical protein
VVSDVTFEVPEIIYRGQLTVRRIDRYPSIFSVLWGRRKHEGLRKKRFGHNRAFCPHAAPLIPSVRMKAWRADANHLNYKRREWWT